MNKKRFFYSLPMILLLIVVFAGWFATDYLGNKAQKEIISESQASILTLSTYLSSTFTTIEGSVKALSGSPWIAPALLSKRDQDIEHANSTLDRYNSATSASVSYLMDANGMTVASSNRKDSDSFVGKSYRFRPYFMEAAKGKPYHYFAMGITSGKRGFYASYPVPNHMGNVIGVVTVKKDIDDMATFFKKYPFCFFISPDGIIFLSSKPEMVLKSLWPLDATKQKKLIASGQFGSKPSEAVTQKEMVDGTEVTLEGKNYFVSRKVIESSGWSIVILTSNDRIWIYKLTGILTTIFVSLLIIVFSGVIYLTDRSRNAILQSEVFLSNIFDNSPHAQWISDERGTLIKQNQACRDLFHLTDEDVVGKYNIFKDKIVEKQGFMPRVCAVFERGEKANFTITYNMAEFRHLNSQQKVSLVLELTISPVKNGDGKVKNAIIQHVDITERKKAEEELRKSENYLSSTLRSIGDGVITCNVEGKIISLNTAAEKLTGWSTDEAMGKPIMEVFHTIHNETRQKTEDLVGRALNENRVLGMAINTALIARDGTEYQITDSCAPISNAAGSIIGAVLVFHDISEEYHRREQTERRRNFSYELLGILNSATDLPDMINAVVLLIKRWTGFDAVGIRLQAGDDFPYFAQKGFSDEFLLTENSLVEHGKDGGLCRDKNGNVSLQCTCGLVISGKTDPENPLFTPTGSFWTNNSFALLELPSSHDPRLNPRNRCMHEGYGSLALIPLFENQKIVGLLQLNNRKTDSMTPDMINFFELIGAYIGETLMRKKAEWALKERFKELNCLYSISSVIEKPGISLDDILKESVMLLPPAWQFPEITQARITLQGNIFQTEHFQETPWMQTHKIFVNGKPTGQVDVCYQEERPISDEGPFLIEERKLIIAIAERLGRVIERSRAEEQIRLNETRLMSLLNIMQQRAKTKQEFLDYALDEVIKLTQSRIGYIYFYHEDKRQFILNTWSRDVMKECRIADPQTCYELDKTGVWGEAVRQRKTIIINDFLADHPLKKGYPEGHANLTRFMTVPVFNDDQIVAVVGIANKASDYDETDVLQLTLFMDAVWKTVNIKTAEETLSESGERIRAITNSANEAITMMDNNGNISYWNPAAQRILGYTREEVIGKNLHALIAPERFLSAHLAAFPEFQKTGQGNAIGKTLELAARRKDGQEIEVALSLSAVKIKGAWHAVGIIQDITENKQAREALTRLSRQNELILNSAAEGILGLDLQGNHSFVNSSAARMLGYEVEELIGRPSHRTWHHTKPDGSPYPQEECKINSASVDGVVRHESTEFFWRKDGTSFPVEYASTPIYEQGRITGVVVTFADITERKKVEDQIKHLATHDLLTDLPSMRLAKDRFSVALNMAHRYKKAVALMFVDLDGFKAVNDSLGHDAGDYVLKQVAQRLLSCVRETDTVARFGGDEFLIIATEINIPENAAQIAEKIIQLVSQPVIFNGQQAIVGTSIGIALFPEHGKDMDELIKQADKAMYEVKNAGKNGFRFVNT